MAKHLILLVIITAFVVAVVFASSFYSSASTAQTAQPTPDAETIEKAKNEYMAKICAGHGGVNCSIFNPDFSVVCNDGTIDEPLLSIYSLPQCQETIENLVNRQSDLMAQTGCYPPSEITCIDQGSYNNTLQRLNSLGLAGSELGKIELEACSKEISIYQGKNNDYKQCLAKNNIAPINLPGDRLVLPILKAVFCPVFYGENASYDSGLDLCVCDEGYFKYNGTCLEKTSVCKIKHGVKSYVLNNDCVLPAPAKTIISSSPIIAKPAPSPLISPQNSIEPMPTPTIQLSPYSTPQITKTAGKILDKPPSDVIGNFFDSLLSRIKNIFKIFR